ncbi:MAG: AMIN domain-containing protein, partial [Marinobacter sp.]|nr:AMIN domain-containing protein [Marinobacter sp.]
MFKKLRVYVGVIAVGLWSSLASAVTLEDVSFTSLPGDALEVKMAFDGEPPEPSGYTIERPARIALDLRGTKSGLDKRSVSLGTSNAQSLTVVEAGERTRLIFNLVDLVPYETERKGNSLIMTIGGGDAPAVASTEPASSQQPELQGAESSSARAEDALAGVDFRRGKGGEGRVVIDLGSSNAEVNLEEEAGRIRLSMPDLGVPEDLRRRLDVTDFATPVTRVDTFT